MDADNVYVCSICGEEYSHVTSFLEHHQQHPDNHKAKNECVRCLKRFKDANRFRQHIMRLHENNEGRLREFVAPKRRCQEVEGEENPEAYQPIEDRVNADQFRDDEEVAFEESFAENVATFLENDEQYLLEVVASLYASKDMTIQKAGEIVNLLESFSKRCVQRCSELISDCTDIEDAKRLVKSMELFDFSDYRSEYKFKNKLTMLDLFVEPTRPTMGYEAIENRPGSLSNVEHHAVFNSPGFQLTKFLEIDGLLESILENQEKLSEVPEGTLKHFVNGRSWKEIVQKNLGKVLIPLFKYNDDFQVDNKIGSHSGSNKVSMFYFLIPTLPPHLLSKLDSIFTGMAVKATDIKEYGNLSPLQTLITNLSALEENGLILFPGTSKEKRVHLVMCKVLGDNLGLHCLCGYKQNFSSNKRPCIICEITMSDLKNTCEINPNLLRNVEKYDNYFLNNTYDDYGLNEESILNTLRSFHVVENFIVDFMHDVQLGVGKFSMEFVLEYFVEKKKYFSLDMLNSRIKNFDPGYKEASNKPEKITKSHLTNGLHMNANESLFLLRYLPLIVFELVPFNDPVYLYLLDTIDMVEACLADEYNTQSLEELDFMIMKNRETYLDLFETDLRPKDHHMLHYKDAIKRNGPLKYISTIRFEAKHQVILSYTRNSNNRQNICYSICKKQGYEFAYFLLKAKEKYLPKILTSEKSNPLMLSRKVEVFMANNNLKCETYVSVKVVSYLGSDYKLNDFIIINPNLAIKITQIFVSKEEETVAVTGMKYSIQFDANVRMYKVIEQQQEELFLLSSFKYPAINLLRCKQDSYLKNKSF